MVRENQGEILRPSNPWGDTQVIWRDQITVNFDGGNPYEAIHQVIADPTRSHIVREVDIDVSAGFLPQKRPETRTQAEVLIEHAEKEFNVLSSLGIEIARPDEWHISDETDSGIVILARSPIVDGVHPSEVAPFDQHIPETALPELEACIDYYYSSAAKKGRAVLSDIEGAHQYVFGEFRFPDEGKRTLAPRPILVDIDLIMVARDTWP